MDIPLKNLTKEMLQEAVNQEAKRRNQKKPTRQYQPRQ